MNTPTRFEALLKAAEIFGSQTAMADALGVTQPTVCRWLHQTKQLPAEHVLRVEAATGVSRHHLRPDIYPADSRFHGVDRRAQTAYFNRDPALKRGKLNAGAA